jgi:hypothetical protein
MDNVDEEMMEKGSVRSMTPKSANKINFGEYKNNENTFSE